MEAALKKQVAYLQWNLRCVDSDISRLVRTQDTQDESLSAALWWRRALLQQIAEAREHLKELHFARVSRALSRRASRTNSMVQLACEPVLLAASPSSALPHPQLGEETKGASAPSRAGAAPLSSAEVPCSRCPGCDATESLAAQVEWLTQELREVRSVLVEAQKRNQDLLSQLANERGGSEVAKLRSELDDAKIELARKHAAQLEQQRLTQQMTEKLQSLQKALLELASCPITHQLMREPALAADNMTYERAAICNWVQARKTSPLTRRELRAGDVRNNEMARQLSLLVCSQFGVELPPKEIVAPEEVKEPTMQEIMSCEEGLVIGLVNSLSVPQLVKEEPTHGTLLHRALVARRPDVAAAVIGRIDFCIIRLIKTMGTAKANALHLAAALGYVDVVQKFLSRVCNVTGPLKSRLAASFELRALHGPAVRLCRGHTPAEVAKSLGHRQIEALILEHLAKYPDSD